MKKFFSVIGSLTAIILSAVLGSALSITLIRLLDWEGSLATFTKLMLSMFFTFMFFTLGIIIRNLISPATKR